MKRVIVTVVAALALAGGALAGDERPLAFGNSYLVAHDVFGLHTLVLDHFAFAAVPARGSGTAARGWFDYKDIEDGAPFTAAGPVTCLYVAGRDAWVGAVIRRSNDPTVVGLGGWWHVTDSNGEGGGDPADITTFLGIGSLVATQAFCDTYPPYRHPFALQRGDVVVRG